MLAPTELVTGGGDPQVEVELVISTRFEVGVKIEADLVMTRVERNAPLLLRQADLVRISTHDVRRVEVVDQLLQETLLELRLYLVLSLHTTDRHAEDEHGDQPQYGTTLRYEQFFIFLYGGWLSARDIWPSGAHCRYHEPP